MMRFVFVLTLLLVLPPVVNAQEPEYEPSYANPAGEEVVLAFVSSSWCAGNRAPGLHEAIERAKLTFEDRAKSEEVGFRAVAVGLDWSTADGIAYFREFGEFDELIGVSNWFNIGVQE